MFVVVFIIGIAGLQVYQNYIHNQFVSENKRLEEKLDTAEQLERTFSTIFSDMRGFMAFKDTTMRDIALQKKEEAAHLIQLVKEVSF